MIFTYKIAFLIIPLIIGIVAIGFLSYALLTDSSEPVVKTDAGTFQGVRADDGEYDMYLGIPYAQVDMSNIFGAAIPQKKFNKVFLANNDTAICPQFEEFDKIITGTLDCLHLNVYTPKFAKTKNRHPVLVFIHGGDHKSGFGRTHLYGPKYLMRHSIVLVTINYRLGPYGFLCSDAAQIGNQGIKDQLLALRWVRDNIVHFGGDPRKVTIAGTGTGGESVNLHLMYGKEELFHKAIIDSGIFMKDKEEDEESAIIELAEALDFEGDNEIEALKYLNEQNIKSVLVNSLKLQLDYGPCLEKEHSDAVITNNTTSQNIKRVPILISHSSKEMLREYAHKNLERQEFRDLIYDELERHFDLEEDELKKMEKHVHHFYLKEERIGERVKQYIVDFASDLHYNYPTKRMIDKYFEDEPNRVYYGVFSFVGKRNFAKSVYNVSMEGATRGDVLGYLFNTPYVEEPVDKTQLVLDYMTTLWTNFVKYGSPTPEKTALLPLKWKPVTRSQLNYLEITTTLTNNVKPFHNRTAFWDMMYKLYGTQERITKNVEPWKNYEYNSV